MLATLAHLDNRCLPTFSHWIVRPSFPRFPSHGDIQGKRTDRRRSATHRECSQCFIHSADHDSSFIVPSCHYAAVAEGPREIPSQEGKTNQPTDGEDGIREQVGCWVDGTCEVDVEAGQEMKQG